MTAWRIAPLAEGSDASAFRCGRAALDEYILRYASQDVRRNLARVFVATPPDNPARIAGYFTLSAGSVACSDLPLALARKLPKYPIPVALIGRLAVDSGFHGKGLGAILLADACRKVVQASSVMAVAGIVVDAKDATAARFYAHFGFAPMPGQTDRMLLPAKALPVE